MVAANAPEAVVEALGAAWTVYSLYPDPESQPAFRRAVEGLQAATASQVQLEIDVSGFRHDGQPVEVDREGSERFAKRCYLHRLESISLLTAPTAFDVSRLFGLLARDENLGAASGGIEAALRRDGVTALAVVQRAMLRVVGEDEVPDRDQRVQGVLDDGLDPEAFANQLWDEAGGDRERLAELFTERYRETLSIVDDEDVYGREGVVQAFVEAFFHFDEPAQVGIFEVFLGSEVGHDRVFLDQFAGHELAKLAPRLDSQGLALLLDYARVATDQADGRPRELLGILRNPQAMQSVREVAAAKVQERLGDLNKAAEEGLAFLAIVRDQFPDPQRYFYDSLEVFRGLLAVEARDDRFARLMRIWRGKVSNAARRQQFRRAELWLRAVTAHPTYPPERHGEVEEALGQIASPDVMAAVVEASTAAGSLGPDATDPAVRLLRALGPRAVNGLVDLLAEEQDRARRRVLIDVLSQVAVNDRAAIVSRLSDDRWYVVRNLLTILRQSGPVVGDPGYLQTLRHTDSRVRVEAIRALAGGGDAALPHLASALDDGDEKVRQAAAAVATTYRTPGGVKLLEEGLEARLDVADKRRLMDALVDIGTPSALAPVESLAKKRFVFGAAARQLRDAARDALERRSARE